MLLETVELGSGLFALLRSSYPCNELFLEIKRGQIQRNLLINIKICIKDFDFVQAFSIHLII